jgi:hypothetical protein
MGRPISLKQRAVAFYMMVFTFLVFALSFVLSLLAYRAHRPAASLSFVIMGGFLTVIWAAIVYFRYRELRIYRQRDSQLRQTN